MLIITPVCGWLQKQIDIRQILWTRHGTHEVRDIQTRISPDPRLPHAK